MRFCAKPTRHVPEEQHPSVPRTTRSLARSTTLFHHALCGVVHRARVIGGRCGHRAVVCVSALTIRVYVSPRAAIMAGRTSVGVQTFNVPEDALQALTESLRLELALAYDARVPIGEDPTEPPVVSATMDGILPILEIRASRRAEAEATQKITEARAIEEAAASTRDATAQDDARARALRQWITDHGDDEQKARMAEGYLRQEEILEEVCDELLELPGFRPYDHLRRGDACDCGCGDQVDFQEGPPLYMDMRQFAKLREAREIAPAKARVEAILHRAHCPGCECVPLARLEARVTLEWSGWLLVRQYTLA